MAERLTTAVQKEVANESFREQFDNRLEEEATKQILKAQTPGSLGQIKKLVKKMAKPRLRKIEQYLCDQCDQIINKPEDGFIVHGNIYTADPLAIGGLIGDNFPQVQAGTLFTTNDVGKTVLCMSCFMKALGINSVNVRGPKGIFQESHGHITENRDHTTAEILARDLQALSGLGRQRPRVVSRPSPSPSPVEDVEIPF